MLLFQLHDQNSHYLHGRGCHFEGLSSQSYEQFLPATWRTLGKQSARKEDEAQEHAEKIKKRETRGGQAGIYMKLGHCVSVNLLDMDISQHIQAADLWEGV